MSSDTKIFDASASAVGAAVLVVGATVVSVPLGIVVAAPLLRILPGPPSVAAMVVSTTVVSATGIVVEVSELRVPACSTGRSNNSPCRPMMSSASC